MRYIKLTSLLLLAAMLVFCSCQGDDSEPDRPHNDGGGTTAVELRLRVKAPSAGALSTRAPEKEDGTSGEMMKNWIILVVRDGAIVRTFTSGGYTGEKEEDAVYTQLDNGAYDFYSFANISLADLGLAEGATTLPADFDKKTFSVDGNQQSVDGFPNGIPMSNKQTITISSTTGVVDLEVIRMVVKVRVEVTNPTDDDLTVQSLAIRDITGNNDNFYLLPGDIANAGTGKRNPALVSTTNDAMERIIYEYEIPAADQVIEAGKSRSFTFYVNESLASDNGSSQFLGSHFILEVRRGNNAAGNGYNTCQFLAFNDWADMARNELHVLPVTLRKFGIAFAVYPYTAIGVLPTYSAETNIFTIFFGLYGHYDMVPRIRNYETGAEYYTMNSTEKLNYTVKANPQGQGSGKETDEITIGTLKLRCDDDEIGIPYQRGGWGSNTDGTLRDGEEPHYPEVGWNQTAMVPRIECITGNYTGWAIYTIDAAFHDNASNEDVTIERRFRIVNTYFDVSNLAKPGWRE